MIMTFAKIGDVWMSSELLSVDDRSRCEIASLLILGSDVIVTPAEDPARENPIPGTPRLP